MKKGPYIDARPLLDWVDQHPEVWEGWGAERNGWVGALTRRLNDWRCGARVSFHTADKVCCKLGVHMRDVFGDDVYFNTPLSEPKPAKRRGGGYPPERTHCVNGHPKMVETAYVRENGFWMCRVCKRASRERYAQKLRPAA